MKCKTYIILGRIITYLAWISCWIIFTVKLDFIMWLGMLLFALGLSGILIFDMGLSSISNKNKRR